MMTHLIEIMDPHQLAAEITLDNLQDICFMMGLSFVLGSLLTILCLMIVDRRKLINSNKK